MITGILVRKLESIAEVTDEQRSALSTLQGDVREMRRGEDVVTKASARAGVRWC